jgi:hypothetical protein
MSDCGVKSPTSLPPVRRSTRRRELITPSRGCCLKATTFPVTRTKRASFSKQPSNPAPRLSATLRKSLGSPDATDRPPRRQERKMDGPKSVIPSECEGSRKISPFGRNDNARPLRLCASLLPIYLRTLCGEYSFTVNQEKPKNIMKSNSNGCRFGDSLVSHRL